MNDSQFTTQINFNKLYTCFVMSGSPRNDTDADNADITNPVSVLSA